MTRGTTRPLHLAALLRTAGWRGPGDGAAAPASAAPADGEARGAPPGPGDVARVVATLARAGRQQDGTTCGAAVLTMLAAAGDPVLAGWLETGHLETARGGHRPPELAGATAAALDRLGDRGAAARVRAVHRVVQRRTARAGVPWPAALGTSPWGAAAVARFPGLRWSHHPLAGPDDVTAHLRRVGGWAEQGIPVPLYSGGDLRTGLSAAVPRHVVLVVGHRRGLLDVWEPSRGAVLSTPLERLASGTGPLPALGGWSRVVWAVVPWRSGSRGARMGGDPVPSERWP